ncbi:UNVERIFIED_CONTAM: Calmodulin calcium-dependent NAD kinase [Sesamum latifolium]|uniref:Calmodulin calcium-dependent NAD kinase n=1 Tax=Sesamum latifolium TaxID=2727402 RepID=A0AAW2Y140_9LAMI
MIDLTVKPDPARHLGFGGRRECPNLCKLVSDYIGQAEGWEDECTLISPTNQIVLGAESELKKNLKHVVMAATRVTKDLKVARLFNTLVEKIKAIGLVSLDDSRCTKVMVQWLIKTGVQSSSWVVGWGLESTVLKDILKEPFCAGASGNAVVIEADAFKVSDVIYKALSSRKHHDMLQTAELVHQSSTDAASSILVTAPNEGRDVIMDGTLSWFAICFANNNHV